VNPAHLYEGTHRDNMRDMMASGRHFSGPPRGEESGQAILTDDAVRAIRSSNDTQRELARRFGVSPSTIRNIRHRRSWRHVA
jgi:DNA-binding transcriptional regulator YiaG